MMKPGSNMQLSKKSLAEELAELARNKKLFLFEAVTTQYQDN